jgi:hypothetical protein
VRRADGLWGQGLTTGTVCLGSAPNDKHAVWVKVTDLEASAKWEDVMRAFSRFGTIKFVDVLASAPPRLRPPAP